jgi:16S rRNA (guanine527-N7)-methyltransferase
VDKRLAELCAAFALPAAAHRAFAVLIEALAQPDAPTSIHEPSDAVDVHIADSLVGLDVEAVRAARVVADLGSGAGLPGLVFACALPDTRVVLVESARRKCDFLVATADAMSLQNADVVRARVEEWTEGARRCDVVTARALATLPVLCEYAAPILRDRGVLIAWKGAVTEGEAADGAAAAALLGLRPEEVRPVMPFAGSERRTLHVLRKVAQTPPGFPRRPGIATKRPLSVTSLR